MNEDGKTMLEQVTGAFLFPWPRKPLGKPTGKGPAKGTGRTSVFKGQKSSKGLKSKGGPKLKKPISGGWY